MASTTTYLNFDGNTLDAFEFYKKVFRSEFVGEPMRMRDVPPMEGAPKTPEDQLDNIMHIQMRILGGHMLMGTDVTEGMGVELKVGNNVHINLMPDTRAEADRLFAELSEGGHVTMPMQDMFWGDYFGSFIDQFGIRWMINCDGKNG